MNSMDTYKIHTSIRDAIVILDSAPIQLDMVQALNIVQLTNRAPIAHLAIDRGLKVLIRQAGEDPKDGHFLNRLYRVLQKCDAKPAHFLSDAFEDAVKFFGYDVKAQGLGYFRSLDDYLAKVGTAKSYEEYRYWATGEPGITDDAIRCISLPIHRELLCALEGLFFSNRRETVLDRVEREVFAAMTRARRLAYGDGEIGRGHSVHWYLNWLNSLNSCRTGLEEAVRRNFLVKDDDEIVSSLLRDAYNELRESKDPAVRYYISTLTYLPKGSERRNPDATPVVEWLGDGHFRCLLKTPAGTCLGFIDKQADGAWAIDAMGLPFQCAEALADAKSYVVNGLTKSVTVTVNGEPNRLRIVNSEDFIPPALQPPHILEFWDGEHGLQPGDEVRVELQSTEFPKAVSILQGKIVEIATQKVSVAGSSFADIKRTANYDT